MSHINYASSIWDGAGELHLKKIDSLHRRSAKIIGRGIQLSTDNKQNQLKIFPLKNNFSSIRQLLCIRFGMTASQVTFLLFSGKLRKDIIQQTLSFFLLGLIYINVALLFQELPLGMHCQSK